MHYFPVWSPDGKYMIYGSRQADEPLDSSRLCLVDVSNPATHKLVVNGFFAAWIDNERFVASSSLESLHAWIYSIHSSQPIRVLADSTLEFPLPDGKGVLLCDSRVGREGWWLLAAGPGSGHPPRQILGPGYEFSAWPSASLRYLLWRKGNGEAWRISLPDGKQHRLPGILDGLNPAENVYQLSYDDSRIVFAKPRLYARLVLIENLFE